VSATEESLKPDVVLAFYKRTDVDRAMARWCERVAANKATVCVCVCESAVEKAIYDAAKLRSLVIVLRTGQSVEQVAHAVQEAVETGLWRLLEP
jgi:3-keto-L-gulonate-6-phosphate decarboxylase